MGQMQTELHTGIELALALIGQKNLPDLLRTATSQMQKTFGLERCWALELDLSGRTLHCSALAINNLRKAPASLPVMTSVIPSPTCYKAAARARCRGLPVTAWNTRVFRH